MAKGYKKLEEKEYRDIKQLQATGVVSASMAARIFSRSSGLTSQIYRSKDFDDLKVIQSSYRSSQTNHYNDLAPPETDEDLSVASLHDKVDKLLELASQKKGLFR